MQMSHTGGILRATCSEVGLIQQVENSWLISSVQTSLRRFSSGLTRFNKRLPVETFDSLV